MFISLYNDLHTEFQPVSGKTIIDDICNEETKNSDICILAGDIGMIKNHTTSNINPLYNTLKQLCDHFKDVIYIHGNHEYYSHSIIEGCKNFQKRTLSKLPNLHWLENEIITIKGQRFLGCTLWAKLKRTQEQNSTAFNEIMFKEKQYSRLNCFNYIKDLRKLIESKNDRSVKFITDNLQKDDILITHFPATKLFIDPKYKGDDLNWYYTNDLEEVIFERKPKLVINGHTHHSIDRTIAGIRFLSNPFGYWRHAENYEFKTDMVIEI